MVGMWYKPDTCRGCLNDRRTVGFCADSVVPNARIAVFAQAPSKTELATDAPLSGPAGFVLSSRVLRHSGLMGEPISKCNVLRCMQPDNKYPGGQIRRDAEGKCRQYDRLTPDQFDVTLLTLHPADLLYTKYDPLVLLVSDFARAKKLLDQGKTVAVLLGTEAKELWAPWLVGIDAGGKRHSGINDWRGHYWHNGTRTFVPLLRQTPCDIGKFRSDTMGRAIGLDLEWDRAGTITIAGFCNDSLYCQLTSPTSDDLNSIIKPAAYITGHNLLGRDSDRERLLAYGVELSVDKVRDTHLMFHLVFPQLAGFGYLDLWTLCSLYTDFPQWKLCRGDGHCFGPCPLHNPMLYNAYDVCGDFDASQQLELELHLRGVL